MRNKVYIIDLETTAQGGPEGDSPEAHWLNNYVLHCGYYRYATPGDTTPWVGYHDLIIEIKKDIQEGHKVTLVGHNFKFDMKYLLRDHPDVEWHKCQYVCTMHREYRLSGHRDKFMGLEAACEKRKVPYTKGLDLGALLASGIKMQDIPDSDLIPYLVDDVNATRQLWEAQNGDIDSHAIHANHLLPLAAMELAGLPLDVTKTQGKLSGLAKQEAMLGKQLFTQCKAKLAWDDGTEITEDDIKFTAPRTISYLLTGHPVKGLVKGKRAIKFRGLALPILNIVKIAKLWGNTKPTHLGYPVPVTKLKALEAWGLTLPTIVLQYRAVQKLMSTYYGPFLHKAAVQGAVYPKMHMVSTATGRGSSADPNGQNMPPPARECFVSENGRFVDVDFSQLEICALAVISQDPVLIADLQNGTDLHYETGRDVMKWKTPADMTPETRRIVKAVNFGLIYGGGAGGLSVSTGQPKPLIKQLIKAFFTRYKRVEEWQAEFYTDVVDRMEPDGLVDGEQTYKSTVILHLSGRRFTFVESPSPPWLRAKTGRKFSFKPTETKNYPVQGFAGGDIVMDALVYAYRLIATDPNTTIRMTVHDSLLFDTNMSERNVREIMEVVCHKIESKYVLPFNLKFDIKSSVHWQ